MAKKTQKRLAIIGLMIAAVLIIGYIYRVQIAVSAIGFAFRMSQDVGPNVPVQWARGTDRPSGDKRPNIIVILTDDMGFNDVSLYGGGMIDTPHIDALAKQGVIFNNGYAGSSVCSISRAMLMTGRYSTRFGFEFTPAPDPFARILQLLNTQNRNPHKMHFTEVEETHSLPFEAKGLPPSEITLAEYLRDANYHTMHIGKWHLGRSHEFLPNQQGFNESLFMASGLYLPIDSPDVVNSRQSFDPIDQVLWQILTYAASFNGGERFEPQGYLTDYYTREAVKAIETNKNRPFMLYLAHWGIHTPLQALKADYDALAEEIPDHRKRVYAAMIRAVDRSVGEVMKALKKHGLDENTLIIFTSDNGGANYVGLPDINKPYRGWKLTFFEGGTHVPFVMRWPSKLPAGKSYPHAVSHLDILPTALAAAGLSLPQDGARKIDGVNLLPYLNGSKRGAPHQTLFWKEGDYQAVISKGWKLQRSKKPNVKRLFHLIRDPFEKNDLAARRPDMVARLTRLLDAHVAEQAAPLWESRVSMPIWIDKTLADDLTPEDDYIYWPN